MKLRSMLLSNQLSSNLVHKFGSGLPIQQKSRRSAARSSRCTPRIRNFAPHEGSRTFTLSMRLGKNIYFIKMIYMYPKINTWNTKNKKQMVKNAAFRFFHELILSSAGTSPSCAASSDTSSSGTSSLRESVTVSVEPALKRIFEGCPDIDSRLPGHSHGRSDQLTTQLPAHISWKLDRNLFHFNSL